MSHCNIHKNTTNVCPQVNPKIWLAIGTGGHNIGRKCGQRGLAARLWILTWIERWSTSTGRSNVYYASTTLTQPASCQPPFPLIRPHFDTDSYPIYINNCCTELITNDLKDVVGKPVPIASQIVGFTWGQTFVVFLCILQWDIEDDEGVSHKILLPNSLYSPEAYFRLLFLQHWSQIAKENLSQPKGTWCAKYDESVVLEWQQRKYRWTVPLDPGTNVATFFSAPGYNCFKAFVYELNNPHEELISCNSRLVSDDEASD